MLDVLRQPSCIDIWELEKMTEAPSDVALKLGSIFERYARDHSDILFKRGASQYDSRNHGYALVFRDQVIEVIGALVYQ